MHYMLVTSITLPLQAASNGRNYMHYMAHYMLSKMLMKLNELQQSAEHMLVDIFILLMAMEQDEELSSQGFYADGDVEPTRTII